MLNWMMMLTARMAPATDDTGGDSNGGGTDNNTSGDQGKTGDQQQSSKSGTTEGDEGEDDDEDDLEAIKAERDRLRAERDALDGKYKKTVKEVKSLRARNNQGDQQKKDDEPKKDTPKDEPKNDGVDVQAVLQAQRSVTRQLAALGVDQDAIDDILDLAGEDHFEIDDSGRYTLDIEAFVDSRPRYKSVLQPDSDTQKSNAQKKAPQAGKDQNKDSGGKAFPKFKFKSGGEVILTKAAISKMSAEEYEEARPEILRLTQQGRIK